VTPRASWDGAYQLTQVAQQRRIAELLSAIQHADRAGRHSYAKLAEGGQLQRVHQLREHEERRLALARDEREALMREFRDAAQLVVSESRRIDGQFSASSVRGSASRARALPPRSVSHEQLHASRARESERQSAAKAEMTGEWELDELEMERDVEREMAREVERARARERERERAELAFVTSGAHVGPLDSASSHERGRTAQASLRGPTALDESYVRQRVHGDAARHYATPHASADFAPMRSSQPLQAPSAATGERAGPRHDQSQGARTRARARSASPAAAALSSQRARPTPSWETLRTLHSRMQQQSYTIGGQDWRRLFRLLDANHTGRIERAEFHHAMRHTLKIAPREVRPRPPHICTGTRLTLPTSAPGLGSPAHICAGTRLTPPTSAPGLGSPRNAHRNVAAVVARGRSAVVRAVQRSSCLAGESPHWPSVNAEPAAHQPA
jgi:hypothetical protein